MESERESNIKYLLHFAEAGELEKVNSFIEVKSVDVNSTCHQGVTALHKAASGGHNEVVEYLISKGAEIDKKTEKFGATPFSYAARKGKVDVAKTLIEHGADTKVVIEGFNFLDMSIKSDNPEMIELALSYGYDIDQYGVSQTTPLMNAISGGHSQSVKFLLQKGADYKKSCADNSSMSPLFIAAQEKESNGMCLKLLLEHVEKKEGKEGLLEFINSKDMKLKGRTALHVACIMHNSDAVEILLEYGADASIKDEIGFSVADVSLLQRKKGTK